MPLSLGRFCKLTGYSELLISILWKKTKKTPVPSLRFKIKLPLIKESKFTACLFCNGFIMLWIQERFPPIDIINYPTVLFSKNYGCIIIKLRTKNSCVISRFRRMLPHCHFYFYYIIRQKISQGTQKQTNKVLPEVLEVRWSFLFVTLESWNA